MYVSPPVCNLLSVPKPLDIGHKFDVEHFQKRTQAYPIFNRTDTREIFISHNIFVLPATKTHQSISNVTCVPYGV